VVATKDVEKYEVSSTSSENFMNFGPHRRLKLGPQFLPTLRKFFVAKRYTRRSANGSQPNFAKWKKVNGADAKVNKVAPHIECK